MTKFYIDAIGCNWRFRRTVESVRTGHLIRAIGHAAFAVSEWHLIARNARYAYTLAAWSNV